MGRYAGVRARGRGYEASWRDGTGKQVCKAGFAKEKDAHDHRVKQLAAIGKGTYVDPQAGKVTVGEQYALVTKNRRVSHGRHAAEASYAKNHLLPRWGEVPIGEGLGVDDDSVQAWVNDLADRLAPRTVRECIALLDMTLAAAVRAKRRNDNPCDHIKAPTISKKRLTHDDVLDSTELGQVVRAVELDRWRVLVLLIGWLGPRLSEALGVRRCDVNLLHGTIRLGQVVIEEVQGNPHPRPGGKTDNAERIVPLPPSLAKALEAHMAEFVEPGPDAFLFQTDVSHQTARTKGNLHPSRGNLLRHMLKPAVAIAGISCSATVRPNRKKNPTAWVVRWYDETGHERRHDFPYDPADAQTRSNAEKEARAHLASLGPNRLITFRQLRHTAASIMLAEGVDPHVVSQWLGHYAPSFTMDTYKHVLKQTVQAGTLAIEQSMRSAM